MPEQTSERVHAPFAVSGRRVVKPTKGERQQRTLLDGFARLLALRSIDEIGVAEIANEAGVGRSAFYAYFDSKYGALAVLTSEAWAKYVDQADVFARRDTESPAQFLDRTGRAAFQVWKDHAAVLVASLRSIPVDRQIAVMWNSWNDRLTDAITEQLRRDVRIGIARPASDDIPRLVTDLNNMMQQAFYLDRSCDSDETETGRMFDSVKAIWLAAAWGTTA